MSSSRMAHKIMPSVCLGGILYTDGLSAKFNNTVRKRSEEFHPIPGQLPKPSSMEQHSKRKTLKLENKS